MQHLLQEAQSIGFGGQTAAMKTINIGGGGCLQHCCAGKLPLVYIRQEFVVVQLQEVLPSLNTKVIDQRLLTPAERNGWRKAG